ncbi:hypothetical protein Tco_1230096 [Tanacetum coccineum]
MSKAKSTKEIDWNDPSVIMYHALKMKPKTVAQARRNMVKFLKNQGNYKIKHESERMKSPVMVEKKTVVPTIPKVNVVKSKQQEKPVRKPVKYAEMYRS